LEGEGWPRRPLSCAQRCGRSCDTASGRCAGGTRRSGVYDLTYVIAFSAAAEQLAHRLSEGEVAPALGAYLFAIFTITWAWMNFTWFTSAYGTDDALLRVATIVQMIGVVVLIFGLPVSFTATAEGGSPNNALLVIGYVVSGTRITT
jgi:hypothetical protein